MELKTLAIFRKKLQLSVLFIVMNIGNDLKIDLKIDGHVIIFLRKEKFLMQKIGDIWRNILFLAECNNTIIYKTPN